MSVRLAIPSGPHHAAAAARHVRDLQDAGHTVVFVSVNLGAVALESVFDDHDVDLGAVQVVDAITPKERAPPAGPMRTTFIGSPNLLELLWMRVERMIQATPDAYVVFCCLNTMVMYNGQQTVDQFMHYACERLARFDVPMDVLLRTEDGSEQMERAVPFVTQRIELAKA